MGMRRVLVPSMPWAEWPSKFLSELLDCGNFDAWNFW